MHGNARAYANNSAVIGVIGTFNSGCAKLEIPIADRAPNGPIAKVSPANTYPGLTISGPGTESGEPDVYYPTGKRNYARVVWNDQFQGAADAQFAKDQGFKKVYVLVGQGDLRATASRPCSAVPRRSSGWPSREARGLGQEGVEL